MADLTVTENVGMRIEGMMAPWRWEADREGGREGEREGGREVGRKGGREGGRKRERGGGRE